MTEELVTEAKNDNFITLVLPGTNKQFVDTYGISIIKNSLDFLPNVRPMIVKILEVISQQILKIKPDVVF